MKKYARLFAGGGFFFLFQKYASLATLCVRSILFGQGFEKRLMEQGKQIGHFTQMIWKETREMGVGTARAKGGNFKVRGEEEKYGFCGKLHKCNKSKMKCCLGNYVL